jgi:hypothetical protein
MPGAVLPHTNFQHRSSLDFLIFFDFWAAASQERATPPVLFLLHFMDRISIRNAPAKSKPNARAAQAFSVGRARFVDKCPASD